MLSILDRRVPQPNDYESYGVPDEIAACVDALLGERNGASEAIVDVIDGAIMRLLEPWIRGPVDVIDLGSICAIDVGFDPRVHDMALAVPMKPGQHYKIRHDLQRVAGKPTSPCVTAGSPEEVCRRLLDQGYRIVASTTPNGREIRATESGFEVQPHNDNYWIEVANLSQAFSAYAQPELYRDKFWSPEEIESLAKQSAEQSGGDDASTD
jgi:hypothetical protein